MPRFLWYALLIMGQLRRSEGLIGYSLGSRLSSLEFWSLSVWKDEESLREFVLEAPHSRVMRAMSPHVGKTESVRWSTDGAYVPPNWREARERMRGR